MVLLDGGGGCSVLLSALVDLRMHTGLYVLGDLNCSAQGRKMDGPERGMQSGESQKRPRSGKRPTMMAQPVGVLEIVVPTRLVKAIGVAPKVPFPRVSMAP